MARGIPKYPPLKTDKALGLAFQNEGYSMLKIQKPYMRKTGTCYARVHWRCLLQCLVCGDTLAGTLNDIRRKRHTICVCRRPPGQTGGYDKNKPGTFYHGFAKDRTNQIIFQVGISNKIDQRITAHQGEAKKEKFKEPWEFMYYNFNNGNIPVVLERVSLAYLLAREIQPRKGRREQFIIHIENREIFKDYFEVTNFLDENDGGSGFIEFLKITGALTNRAWRSFL